MESAFLDAKAVIESMAAGLILALSNLMDTATLKALGEIVKSSAPFLGAVSGPVALFAWWTARTMQLHQNSKTVLDALQTEITTANDDPKYKKFLADIRKEKLARLAFGCSVRSGDLGRLMDYYDQGFATTEDICLAWNHRNQSGEPLSFRLGAFETAFLAVVLLYMVACALTGMVATIVLLSLPAEAGRQIAPYSLGFLCLAALTFSVFHSHITAALLRIRENRHHKASQKLAVAA